MKTASTLVLSAVLLASAPAAAERERNIHVIAVGLGLTLYLSSETFLKSAISPDACRWCGVNRLDRSVRDALVWDTPRTGAALSNVTAGIGLGGSAVLLALSSSGAGERWLRIVDDFIPVLEATIAADLVAQIVKISVARQRPYAHFATEPFPTSPEDNLSFYSGHAVTTFSFVVAAGSVAQRRGSRLAPAIWIGGTALAAATAYLRVAGDRHYLTDVLVGSALGGAFGYAVPRLTGSLPVRVAITPAGLAVAGSF